MPFQIFPSIFGQCLGSKKAEEQVTFEAFAKWLARH